MPGHGSFPSLIFHVGDDFLLAPSHLRGEVSQGAEFAEVAQLDTSHSVRHADALLGVVRSRDSLENFEATQGSGSTGTFVRDHASDSAPEDTGGSAVMHEGAAGVS